MSRAVLTNGRHQPSSLHDTQCWGCLKEKQRRWSIDGRGIAPFEPGDEYTRFIALIESIARDGDKLATGVLGSSRQQLFMIPGRLFQGIRNHQFLNQLSSEIDELVGLGSIKAPYLQSEEFRSSLQQILAALESPPVDEQKFNCLNGIFLSAAIRGSEDQSNVQPALLLEIAGRLSIGEMLVLAASYRCDEKTRKLPQNSDS